MFNKKVLAATMAVAITTGGMIAGAQAAPVGVTTNNVGQVLLGPVYFVENGYTTKLTLTNTRTDAAVLAKVVFRSHGKSTELLDFHVYLSPGDVWRGEVVQGSDGLAHIVSSDDSMRDGSDSGWADTTPVDQAFFDHALVGSDSTTFGHFEVIGTWAAAGDYTQVNAPALSAATVTVAQGMSKDDVKAIFDAADNGTVAVDNAYANCTPAQIAALGGDTVSTIAPCSVQLLGEVTIGSAGDPNRASMRMTALGVANATDGVALEADAENAGYVITNPLFKTSLGAETLLGNSFGVLGGTCDDENLSCIEAGLAGAQTVWEYESDADETTHTAVTFPTKYRHEGDVTGLCRAGGAGGVATAADQYSAPFQDTTTGEMQYSFTSFNNSEQSAVASGSPFSGAPSGTISAFNDEVNYDYTMAYFSTSGWAKYTWAQVALANCEYNGAPVISYTYKFRPGATTTETMLQETANQSFAPVPAAL